MPPVEGWPPSILTPVGGADIRAGDGSDVLRFIGAYGRITKDSIAGRSGLLLPIQDWQRRLIGAIFARDPTTRRRRHRTALVGMGRKNGKTGLVAPVAVYGLLVEGDGAEVYSCAADRAQAKLVFEAACRTVELDPELSRLVRRYRDVIEYPATGSIYRALSSEAYTKEGLSPTLVIADELHAWPNRELYDVMALAMGARVDPLMVIVTTAGVRTDPTGRDSIAHTLYGYGRRVASGELDDPSFFMAWWQAGDGRAVDDPAGWAEANPGLGVILDRAELAGQARKALSGGMSESEFRIKRLNQWVTSATAWLPAGAFEARAVTRRLQPGEPVVLGFDGSFNHDCTVLVAATLDGYLEVLGCWERPLDALDWQVPIAEVTATILAAVKHYTVLEIAADPFRWSREIQDWAAAGLPAFEFPTTSPARMVPACATFYDAVIGGTLSHSGDPRLVRHVANAVVKVDRLGPRIVKEHRGSARSIDLAVAAVLAFNRAIVQAATPRRQQVGAFLA